MGLLYQAACTDCEYFEQLYEGTGFSGALMKPMLCHSCRRVVSVQTTPATEAWVEQERESKQEINRCPDCEGSGLEGWGTFEEEGPGRPGACPECGGVVELENSGLWD